MATKQEHGRDEFDDALRQLREEFDDRFAAMESKMSKSLHAEKKTQEKEDEVMQELRHRFKAVGERMNHGVDRADDLVRDHPVLVAGGALAVGLALGALLAGRSRD